MRPVLFNNRVLKMKKIQTTSRMLSRLFLALCWIIPLGTAYLVLFHLKECLDWGLFSLMLPSEQVQHIETFSPAHRLLILAIQFLPISITVFICASLARLFKLYEYGRLFEEDNIKLVRRISIYMLSGELLHLVYQPLMTVALTFNNPPGERMASISLGSTNVATLITALIILVASWIFKEANQLNKEAQLTI